MRWLLISLLLSLSAGATADSATFYLNDGSTVVGEVQSLQNGIYLIEAESLGRLEIQQKNVRSIQYGTASSVAGSSQLSTQPALDANALGMSMLSNPAILSMIASLKNDPQFQEIAADPEIQRAINSGDYLSLMANPKIVQLMNHKTVKAISSEIQR